MLLHKVLRHQTDRKTDRQTDRDFSFLVRPILHMGPSKNLGGGGGPLPWVGKGATQNGGSIGRSSQRRKRRLGSQLFFILKL